MWRRIRRGPLRSAAHRRRGPSRRTCTRRSPSSRSSWSRRMPCTLCRPCRTSSRTGCGRWFRSSIRRGTGIRCTRPPCTHRRWGTPRTPGRLFRTAASTSPVRRSSRCSTRSGTMWRRRRTVPTCNAGPSCMRRRSRTGSCRSSHIRRSSWRRIPSRGIGHPCTARPADRESPSRKPSPGSRSSCRPRRRTSRGGKIRRRRNRPRRRASSVRIHTRPAQAPGPAGSGRR